MWDVYWYEKNLQGDIVAVYDNGGTKLISYKLYLAITKNNAPMYAYYRNELTGSAHYIIVTGVDLKNNIVYTNNPWGVQGVQTYEEFCNGVATKNNQSDLGMKLVSIYYCR